ncbi:MAG: type II toxin-antitoxin system VapC family toxin [Planctomycetota bacterium]
MKYLLDTHVLLWWLHDASRLRPETRALFADSSNQLLWSACSTWELAIKSQLGKLRLEVPLHQFVVRVLAEQDLEALPVHHAHSARVAELPLIHRDPFDRLLVAQAAVEGVPFLTADAQLAAYGIECIAA